MEFFPRPPSSPVTYGRNVAAAGEPNVWMPSQGETREMKERRGRAVADRRTERQTDRGALQIEE